MYIKDRGIGQNSEELAIGIGHFKIATFIHLSGIINFDLWQFWAILTFWNVSYSQFIFRRFQNLVQTPYYLWSAVVMSLLIRPIVDSEFGVKVCNLLHKIAYIDWRVENLRFHFQAKWKKVWGQIAIHIVGYRMIFVVKNFTIYSILYWTKILYEGAYLFILSSYCFFTIFLMQKLLWTSSMYKQKKRLDIIFYLSLAKCRKAFFWRNS